MADESVPPSAARSPRAAEAATWAAAGAGSGALATLAMSALMLAAGRLGLMGRYPPQRLATFTLARLGVGPLARWKVNGPLAAALHIGFGATLGTGFSLLPSRVRHLAPEPAVAVAFASLVWLVSYWGWIPTLGVLPPPDRDRPGRPVSILVAHWVFGATLGAGLLALEREGIEPAERQRAEDPAGVAIIRSNAPDPAPATPRGAP